jgi:hypothetical protein
VTRDRESSWGGSSVALTYSAGPLPLFRIGIPPVHWPVSRFASKIGSPVGTSIGRHWARRFATSAEATFLVVLASQ